MTTYLEYARRGKTSWWRYPICAIAAVLGAIVIGAVISAILQSLRLLPRDTTQQLSHPSSPSMFFGGVAAVMGVFLAALIAFVFLIHRKRFSDLIGTWRWRAFAAGFAIWFCVQIVSCATDFLIAPGGFRITVGAGTASLAVVALLALAIQTFTEEFLFRGYLTQGLLLATRNPLVASVLSALLFGALHIPNGMPQAVSATFFGFVCSLIAIRTAGLACTAGLHLANNFFGAVVVVSGDDVFKGSPGFLTQKTPHLMWLDVAFTVVALFATLRLTVGRLSMPEYLQLLTRMRSRDAGLSCDRLNVAEGQTPLSPGA
jgi:membrane protease YdiL (CAAX protease family)